MGVATAGVALASGNIVMKLSPSGQATAFLAASSVVSATAARSRRSSRAVCDFFARGSSHSHSPGQAASVRSPFRCSTFIPGHSSSAWRLWLACFRCIGSRSCRKPRDHRPTAGTRSAAGSTPVDPKLSSAAVCCVWSSRNRAGAPPSGKLRQPAGHRVNRKKVALRAKPVIARHHVRCHCERSEAISRVPCAGSSRRRLLRCARNDRRHGAQ